MAQIERRQARLSQIRAAMEPSHPQTPQPRGKSSGQRREYSSPDRRYVLAASQNEPLDLSLFTVVPGTTFSDKHLKVRSTVTSHVRLTLTLTGFTSFLGLHPKA